MAAPGSSLVVNPSATVVGTSSTIAGLSTTASFAAINRKMQNVSVTQVPAVSVILQHLCP